MPDRVGGASLRPHLAHTIERAKQYALWDSRDDFEAGWPIEDERDAVERLLVAGEELDDFGVVGARRQLVCQLVRVQHPPVFGDPVGVDPPELFGDEGGVLQSDGDGLAVAEIESAGDLQGDSSLEIVDPDLPIATLNEEGHLKMQVQVKRGRGYVAADRNFEDDLGIGYIPLDSVHSPVRRSKRRICDGLT